MGPLETLIPIKFEHTSNVLFSKLCDFLVFFFRKNDRILYPRSIACIHNLLKSNKGDFSIYLLRYWQYSPKLSVSCQRKFWPKLSITFMRILHIFILSKETLARSWMNCFLWNICSRYNTFGALILYLNLDHFLLKEMYSWQCVVNMYLRHAIKKWWCLHFSTNLGTH